MISIIVREAGMTGITAWVYTTGLILSLSAVEALFLSYADEDGKLDKPTLWFLNTFCKPLRKWWRSGV